MALLVRPSVGELGEVVIVVSVGGVDADAGKDDLCGGDDRGVDVVEFWLCPGRPPTLMGHV